MVRSRQDELRFGRWFGFPVALISLVIVIAVFTPNAEAIVVPTVIPGTGDIFCLGPSPLPPICMEDPAYTLVPVGPGALSPVHGGPIGIIPNTVISRTDPGFVPAPAGTQWIAPGSDTGAGYPGIVFDFRVFFNATTTGPITISGDLAAEGSVAAFVDGLGAYLGNQSLLALNPFSLTVNAASGSNFLDFVFSGCVSFPACTGEFEPVAALLVDPSFVPAAPGTPVDIVSESEGFADGGVMPATVPISTPEPSSLLLLGIALLALVSMRIPQRMSAASLSQPGPDQ